MTRAEVYATVGARPSSISDGHETWQIDKGWVFLVTFTPDGRVVEVLDIDIRS